MSTQANIETINQIIDTHELLQTESHEWCCSECEWTAQGWWGDVAPQFGDHLMAHIMTTLLPPNSGHRPRTA